KVFKKTGRSFSKRLLLSLPLFAIAFGLTQIEFGIIWRYFAWSNQTLATVVLWTITIYLVKSSKNYWVSLVPAAFMTAVCSSYILIAPEGFSLNHTLAYPIAGFFTVMVLAWFLMTSKSVVKSDGMKND
ncbi:UNVERIFIED_CONTAM: hypothetical protein GTU68_028401, partial [Idotea baltica]|nr:hypothetical protein [Idotea baltica]